MIIWNEELHIISAMSDVQAAVPQFCFPHDPGKGLTGMDFGSGGSDRCFVSLRVAGIGGWGPGSRDTLHTHRGL